MPIKHYTKDAWLLGKRLFLELAEETNNIVKIFSSKSNIRLILPLQLSSCRILKKTRVYCAVPAVQFSPQYGLTFLHLKERTGLLSSHTKRTSFYYTCGHFPSTTF